MLCRFWHIKKKWNIDMIGKIELKEKEEPDKY